MHDTEGKMIGRQRSPWYMMSPWESAYTYARSLGCAGFNEPLTKGWTAGLLFHERERWYDQFQKWFQTAYWGRKHLVMKSFVMDGVVCENARAPRGDI